MVLIIIESTSLIFMSSQTLVLRLFLKVLWPGCSFIIWNFLRNVAIGASSTVSVLSYFRLTDKPITFIRENGLKDWVLHLLILVHMSILCRAHIIRIDILRSSYRNRHCFLECFYYQFLYIFWLLLVSSPMTNSIFYCQHFFLCSGAFFFRNIQVLAVITYNSCNLMRYCSDSSVTCTSLNRE